MPLLVAPLFAVSLGLCFGLLTLDGRGARGYLAARSSVRLFALVAFFPALILPALLRPAWAAMHFANRAPSAVALVGAALAALIIPIVYERATVLGALSRGRAAAAAALPGVLGLAVLVLLHHRTLVLTPAVPRIQEAEPLFGSVMGVAFVLVDVLLLVAAGLTAFALVDATPEERMDARPKPRIEARSNGRIDARPREPASQMGRKLLSAASSHAGGGVRRAPREPLPTKKRSLPTKKAEPDQ